MRLIDADALVVAECGQCDGACDICDGEYCLKCNSHNKCQLREAIDYAPSIDAEPVRHGRWEHGMRCSGCGQVDTTKPNYCPNCGAKMDAEDINVPTNEPGKICPINGAPCNECVPGAHCAKMDGGGE